MNVILLAGAEREAQEIFESLLDTSDARASLFLDELEETQLLLQTFPLIGRSCAVPVRKLKLASFPYAVFYVVESDRVAVLAILDLRQDPSRIARRLNLPP